MDALKAFKPTFQTSEGTLLGTEAEAEAMEQDDVEQEQIVKQKRG
jgi:F-type H+-transporting ATPase subunit alpha